MTQSGNMLNTIIIRTIQSGTITAVVSCCHIILFLRLPMTYLDLVPYDFSLLLECVLTALPSNSLYAVGKLYASPGDSAINTTHRYFLSYANVLLANLNGRQRMKAHSRVVIENSYPQAFELQPNSFGTAEMTRGSESRSRELVRTCMLYSPTGN